MQIGLGDARDKLSRLVQAVLDGDQVTICKNGEPVVDLVRTTQPRKKPRRLGAGAGKNIIIDPNWHRNPETDDELEAWMEGRFE